jgi:hypothetical protein
MNGSYRINSEKALRGIHLKIERANAHIREVSALIDSFQAPNPYESFIQVNALNGVKCIKIRLTEEPPAEISVISGEILYLLRSALDHLVTSVATHRHVLAIERTSFPIERTREKFEAKLTQRKIGHRLPELADALRTHEPYEGGKGDLLWWLHWLNGMEKHKILLAVAGANVGFELKGRLNLLPDFDKTKDLVFGLPKQWQRLDKGATVLLHPIATEFLGEIDLDMNVVFGDIERSEPYTVTDTLQRMSDFTHEIVGTFEHLFFTPP